MPSALKQILLSKIKLSLLVRTAFLALLAVGFFQNCGKFSSVSISSSVIAGSSYCLQHASDSNCLAVTPPTCAFNGSIVTEGASVTAYQSSSVVQGSTCTNETRTCNGGSLSGSYNFASCAVGAAPACLFNGTTIADGQSVTAFLGSSVPSGSTCQTQTRICSKGNLSGSYQYGTCAIAAPSSCLFNGQTIAHGATVVAYANPTSVSGQTCQPLQRTCYNGALTGSGDYASCTNGAANCLFDGQTLASGQNVSAYIASTAPYGSVCTANTRTCTNGLLDGTGDFSSCSVNQPASCLVNGQTIPSGASLTLYNAPTGTAAQPCSAENRVCTNGVMSGSASFSTCTTVPDRANFNPQNRPVTPFSSERLLTVVATNQSAGQTGQWWCDSNFGGNFGGDWRCLEVSGGGSCTTDVSTLAAVSCLNRPSTKLVVATIGNVAGQTGQWWCDNNFGKNLGGQWLCQGVTGGGDCATAVSQSAQISCRPLLNPATVQVTSGPTAGQTGQWWCETNFGNNKIQGQWNCATQTNPGGDCNAASLPGSVVTCERLRNGTGDGRYLKPDVACQRDDIDVAEKEFCVNTDYTKYRTDDTWYMNSRYARVGVNRAYGGAVFELYGTDFINRIQEHGGAAVQLSMWGYDANAAGAAYFTTNSCNPTPYPSQDACMPNNAGASCDFKAASGYQISDCSSVLRCGNWSAAAPINPIQAQAANCGWDRTTAAITNNAAIPDGIKIARQNPYNFTKTSVVNGMYWDQSTTVPENAPYAKLQYNVNYSGLALGPHNQEIPAIFAALDIGFSIYIYEDSLPYQNSASGVTQLTSDQINAVWLPNRPGEYPQPLASQGHFATEDWMSTCDVTQTRCVTIATFSPRISAVVVGGAIPNYITTLGRFALSTGFTDTWTVYIFPYRFDDVVEGRNIRQWIYDLHSKGN